MSQKHYLLHTLYGARLFYFVRLHFLSDYVLSHARYFLINETITVIYNTVVPHWVTRGSEAEQPTFDPGSDPSLVAFFAFFCSRFDPGSNSSLTRGLMQSYVFLL